MFGLTKLRIFEIGVALLLTLAAIVFVGLTVWAAETGRIDVADAWARPTLGQGRVAAAYMTIANKGKHVDILKRVHTRRAKSVEMRQVTTTPDGIMQVHKLEGGLPIAAGGSVVLEPDGTHLMLVGLEDAPRVGDAAHEPLADHQDFDLFHGRPTFSPSWPSWRCRSACPG